MANQRNPWAPSGHYPAASSPEESRTWTYVAIGACVLAALTLLVALGVSAFSGSDDDTAPSAAPPGRNAVGGSSYLDGELPADTPCLTLPEGCTPRPTAAQARLIEEGIASAYPGVPPGKATDWAINTCDEIRSGRTDEELLDSIQARYAGGDRPDPTRTQAEQILNVIRDIAFCATS